MAAALLMAVQQACLAVAMVPLQVMVHLDMALLAMAVQGHQTITEAWALLPAHVTAAITTAVAATVGIAPATD